MAAKEETGSLFDRLKYHSWFLLLLWTGCIAASLLWNLYEQGEKILNIARNSAEIRYENDVLYRRWAAKQGGLYVPVSEFTPPNPHLNVPDRDVTTSSGLSLTLVNPAYMARQVNQMGADIRGSQGHITSLNPIRPENSADAWEAAALKSFERGIQEVGSVEIIAGEEHMRLMRPFIAEKPCLKCHASQGYKEGDIRGGISVSIPMAPLWAIEKPLIAKMSLAHLLLWIVGMVGIVISKKGLGKQILARERAEAVLKQEKDFMKSLIETATDAIVSADHEGKVLLWNPAAERIFGYTPAGAIGRKLEELITPELSMSPLKKALSGDSFKDLELELKKKDGTRFPAEISISSGMKSGENPIDTIIVKDITERKHAEEALRQRTRQLQQLTETLEQRVGERTAELATLSSQLLSAQENERRRISHDLHDDVWQSLVAIRFDIEHLFSRQDEPDWAAFHGKSKQVIATILDAVSKIRSMQGDLWPYVLDDIGILATIGWYCREFEKNHPALTIERHVDLAEDEVPSTVKILIYRVLQETLTNVAKHSQASLVTLRLLKNDHRLEFVVEDNGIGFDLEETILKRTLWGGLGLLSIKARTELSGGLFGVESTRGKGTRVRASWPFHEKG